MTDTIPSGGDEIRQLMQREVLDRIPLLLRYTSAAGLRLQVPNSDIFIIAGPQAWIDSQMGDVATNGCAQRGYNNDKNTAPAAATVLTDERIDLALMALQEAGEIAQAALGAKKSGTELRTQFKRIINVARAGIADVERLLAHAGVTAEPKQPTDISQRLREYANNPGYSHNDYADTMCIAADECERFYGGMMNWKTNAQAKDRTIIDLRDALKMANERLAELTAHSTIPTQAPAADEVRAVALQEAVKACEAERVEIAGPSDAAYNLATDHCIKAIRALTAK